MSSADELADLVAAAIQTADVPLTTIAQEVGVSGTVRSRPQRGWSASAAWRM
jgi:hypothetical protein